MALTKRRIVSVLSTLYLICLTVLSAYSLDKTLLHSLPISTTLSAFTLALPLISGLTIFFSTTLPASRPLLKHSTTNQPREQPLWQKIAFLALAVLSTVLATLSGTHLPSSPSQTCELDTKWMGMFRQRNGKAIQKIQDAFNCCGLHSIVDKAYPFPSKNVGVNACSKMFEREKSCFGDWRSEEARVAGLMLVVILGVVLWEVLILLFFNSGGEAWWSQVIGEGHDTENQVNGRRALGFGDSGERGRFLDQPRAAAEEIDESQDGRDEDATLPHSRVQPSQLREETEHWASQQRE